MAIVTDANIFFGWTQPELERLLQRVKSDMQTRGIDYKTSYNINGKSFTFSQRMNLRELMAEIRKALQSLDPDTYGTPPPRTTEAYFGNTRL